MNEAKALEVGEGKLDRDDDGKAESEFAAVIEGVALGVPEREGDEEDVGERVEVRVCERLCDTLADTDRETLFMETDVLDETLGSMEWLAELVTELEGVLLAGGSEGETNTKVWFKAVGSVVYEAKYSVSCTTTVDKISPR